MRPRHFARENRLKPLCTSERFGKWAARWREEADQLTARTR
jgi:hypothetical protein